MGANQGNVIVSGEATTKICMAIVKNVEKYDFYNGAPVEFKLLWVNFLWMIYFGLAV